MKRRGKSPRNWRNAARHRRTPEELCLAGLSQRGGARKGFVTIPKSTNEGRIHANADVFEFELEDVDMKSIDALKRGERFADPRNITF